MPEIYTDDRPYIIVIDGRPYAFAWRDQDDGEQALVSTTDQAEEATA